MEMVVAYDIADPKRLRRIAKIMKDYGVRVQKSIFTVSIRASGFNKMRARIEAEIEPLEDGVKYFPLCEKCAATVEIIGQGVFVDPDEEFYVV